MQYIIYIIKNTVNRKQYIGQTTNYQKRISEHLKTAFDCNHFLYNHPLYQDMREYDLSVFVFDVLCHVDTQEAADILEDAYIKKYNTIVDNGCGYNLNYGGKHGIHSVSTLQKMNNVLFPAGEQNISYGKTGVDSFAGKKVRNITTGITYNTMRECALAEYGDIKFVKAISKCCSLTYNCFSYKGNEYRYVDKNGNVIPKQVKPLPKTCDCPIIETYSGNTFSTITECSKYYGLSIDMIRNRVYGRIKNDKFANMYHFELITAENVS